MENVKAIPTEVTIAQSPRFPQAACVETDRRFILLIGQGAL
jgi:hypothetical protein